MRNTPSETLLIDWVREHFGIEDEDELLAVLADPSEMLALLDMAQAVDADGARPLIRAAGRFPKQSGAFGTSA